jgi:hypothetical protein
MIPKTGMYFIIYILECLNKMTQKNPTTIKCIRYLMTLIDKLFSNEQTRSRMVYGLCIFFNENSSNIVKEMFDLCMMKEADNEIHRQAQKLRKIVSEHINNIVRLSDAICVYFPITSSNCQRNEYSKVYKILCYK